MVGLIVRFIYKLLSSFTNTFDVFWCLLKSVECQCLSMPLDCSRCLLMLLDASGSKFKKISCLIVRFNHKLLSSFTNTGLAAIIHTCNNFLLRRCLLSMSVDICWCLSMSADVCQCLPMSVFVTWCLLISVDVCRCLSMSVAVCCCLSLHTD